MQSTQEISRHSDRIAFTDCCEVLNLSSLNKLSKHLLRVGEKSCGKVPAFRQARPETDESTVMTRQSHRPAPGTVIEVTIPIESCRRELSTATA